jgi:predicted HNH restriction endonuclease
VQVRNPNLNHLSQAKREETSTTATKEKKLSFSIRSKNPHFKDGNKVFQEAEEKITATSCTPLDEQLGKKQNFKEANLVDVNGSYEFY